MTNTNEIAIRRNELHEFCSQLKLVPDMTWKEIENLARKLEHVTSQLVSALQEHALDKRDNKTPLGPPDGWFLQMNQAETREEQEYRQDHGYDFKTEPSWGYSE